MKTPFEKVIDDLMEALLQKAKQRRESYGYSGDEKFVQVAVLIKPDLEPVAMPVPFTNESEKRRSMWALAATARITRAPAVLLITDARWAQSDKLIPALGLPVIDGQESLDKFQEEYHRILKEKYDGQIKNLPRECWSEAVLVVAKGPDLKPIARLAPYEEGPGDSIRWLPEDLPEGIQEWPMLEDWWVR